MLRALRCCVRPGSLRLRLGVTCGGGGGWSQWAFRCAKTWHWAAACADGERTLGPARAETNVRLRPSLYMMAARWGIVGEDGWEKEGWRLGVGSVPYFFVVSNDARWGKAMGIGPWPAVLPCCVPDWRIAAAALRHGTCRANRPPHWQPRLLSSAQLRQTGLIVGSLISET